LFTQVCAVGEHPEDFKGVHHGEAVRRISAGEKNRRRSRKKVGLEKIVVDGTQQVPLAGLQKCILPDDQHQQKQFTRHDKLHNATLSAATTRAARTHARSRSLKAAARTDWSERERESARGGGLRLAPAAASCLAWLGLARCRFVRAAGKAPNQNSSPAEVRAEFAAAFTSGPTSAVGRGFQSKIQCSYSELLITGGMLVGGSLEECFDFQLLLTEPPAKLAWEFCC